MMRDGVIELKTPDGRLPVRVFEPPTPTCKGSVIFYMDAFGMRSELDRMCRRYADAGYVTFLPDLYYRLGSLRFAVPGKHEPLDPAMLDANVGTTVEMTIADTGALLAHIAAQQASCAASRFGAVGYCMGARHALGACATYPSAIKAAACLHGGRLVWDGPNSPHLYIPRCQGALYFAFAANDETCPDAHKILIEQTIAQNGVRGRTEHYAAKHGWTFPERWCYDAAAAEKVFARVQNLLNQNLDD